MIPIYGQEKIHKFFRSQFIPHTLANMLMSHKVLKMLVLVRQMPKKSKVEVLI